jgi:hypothetical protein
MVDPFAGENRPVMFGRTMAKDGGAPKARLRRIGGGKLN